MAGARSLIAVFHKMNKSEDRTIAHFTPSLIGMFGSTGIFDTFLAEIDAAIAAGQIPASLKKRAGNLIGTYIPQVAEYNGIDNPASFEASADALKGVTADTLKNRRRGTEIILSSLTAILKEVDEM